MTATGSFAAAVRAIAAATAPLADELASADRALALLAGLGLVADEPPPALLDIAPAARAVATKAAALDQASPGGLDEVAAAVDLSVALGTLCQALAGLGPALAAELETQAPGIDVAAAGRLLLDRLVLDYLAGNARIPYGMAFLAGLAETRFVPAIGAGGTGTADPDTVEEDHFVGHELADDLPTPNPPLVLQPTLHLDRIEQLVDDVSEVLSAAFGWGSADFAAERIQLHLLALARAAGVDATLLTETVPAGDPDDADVTRTALRLPLYAAASRTGLVEVGVDLRPLPPGAADGTDAGLAFAPYAVGGPPAGAEVSVGLSTDVTLTLAGTLDLSGDAFVTLRPPLEFAVGGGAPAGAELRIAARSAPPGGVTLFAAPGLISVTAEAIEVGGDLVPEPRLFVSVTGGEVSLGAGDMDTFLAAFLPPDGLTAPFEVSIEWTPGEGVRFAGAAGLELSLATTIALGPITIDALALVVAAGDAGLSVSVTVDAGFAVGPFAALVMGIGGGVALRLAAGGGNLGPVELEPPRFLPPTMVGLSVDIAGVVTGGGFVGYEPDIGRYSGALAVDILAVGVAALLVIDTRPPGDPDGFALFASLSATFPGLPLGFGFSLTGVGGLVALNRAFDGEAFALGLREGAADALLFPSDPVRDATLLISSLDEYFPLLPGNTVIGPVVEISWGVPILISGQLGVVISVPQMVIAVLGSVEALLPVPDAPVLELHLDTLGVLDLAAGTMLVTASVYDSRLLGFIELSGDAAVYVSVGANPYFMLSVGGFHPGFQPPATVPSVFGSLRRMQAEVDFGVGVTASITSYFAVTSNTLQMGGGFELEASAEVAFSTYVARGWFEFDVLLQVDPFLLIADVSAGVGVYAGDRELLGVQLDAHVEGPDPWFAAASASFRFFGIKVRFAVTVGGHAPPAVPASVDVLDLVADQLALDEAWSPEAAAGEPAGVILRDGVSREVLRPDDRIVVRQRVAPLGHTLERFGTFVPVQTTVTISEASLETADGTPVAGIATADVPDWFAPATFSVLKAQERLAAPSYEEMTAGISFGVDGVEFTAAATDQLTVAGGHETSIWEPATGTFPVKGRRVLAARPAEAVRASSAAGRLVTRARPRVAGVSVGVGGARRAVLPGSGTVSIRPTTYAVVDTASGAPITDAPLDYAGAVRASGTGTRVSVFAGRSTG